MSLLVVKHDGAEIVEWQYTSDESYEVEDGELITDMDHRQLHRMVVEDGKLVKNPDYDSRSPVEKRLSSVEQATGMGDKQLQKGIAQRLDNIEERLEELETD